MREAPAKDTPMPGRGFNVTLVEAKRRQGRPLRRKVTPSRLTEKGPAQMAAVPENISRYAFAK
jgi:hypothetical protein